MLIPEPSPCFDNFGTGTEKEHVEAEWTDSVCVCVHARVYAHTRAHEHANIESNSKH